ncbi:MAG: hypothetical protein JNG90_14380, partial [Planctomycetaceae bacterium]|nr:hypothetical protein [Planctomycetaceae bacterium]
AILILLGCSAVQAAAPSSDPIQSTTELGITVEPSHIFDAFEESIDFWPSVRKYVVSDSFDVAERQNRVQAAAFVKRVQDDLHGRLFGGDEAKAKDVVDYVTWGLRRAQCYRDLRGELPPESLVRLRGQFEALSKVSRQEGRPLDPTTVSAEMETAMRPLNLTTEKQTRALELWRRLAVCTARLNATEAAMVIHRADGEAGSGPDGDLIRKIAAAADWALIVKTGKKTTRQDFIAAWHELHDQPVAEVASAMGQ